MTIERVEPASPGAEIATPIYVLSPHEADALAACAKPLRRLDIAYQTELYCHAARRLGRNLPSSMRDVLRNFRERGSSTGILVLRSAQVGPVPPTPPDNTRSIGRHTQIAHESAVVLQRIAQMVAYEAEAMGAPQQDMVPNREKRFAQESQGSRRVLEAHTEQCFSDLRPDYLSLACLRGDPNAATYSFTARQLMSYLSQQEVAMLREPLWTTQIDPSFQPYIANPHEVRGPLAVLSGPTGDPTLLIDQDLMQGVTPEARRLLAKVIDIYEQYRTKHVLQRADILLLDNRRAMHGRSAFQPQFDGGDRFVVRSMALRDLATSAHARRGRLVLARYS